MNIRHAIKNIGRDMARLYAENKANGMTTAESCYNLCGYDIYIECLPWDVNVEIRKNGHVINCLPNIENAIRNTAK